MMAVGPRMTLSGTYPSLNLVPTLNARGSSRFEVRSDVPFRVGNRVFVREAASVQSLLVG